MGFGLNYSGSHPFHPLPPKQSDINPSWWTCFGCCDSEAEALLTMMLQPPGFEIGGEGPGGHNDLIVSIWSIMESQLELLVWRLTIIRDFSVLIYWYRLMIFPKIFITSYSTPSLVGYITIKMGCVTVSPIPCGNTTSDWSGFRSFQNEVRPKVAAESNGSNGAAVASWTRGWSVCYVRIDMGIYPLVTVFNTGVDSVYIQRYYVYCGNNNKPPHQIDGLYHR